MPVPRNEGDAAKGDVAEKVHKETEQGFHGQKVDPRPDSAYALTSGPDSPGAVDDDVTRIDQHAASKGA